MVGRRQYETLVRLLPDLYSARTLDEFPTHVVSLLPRLIAADSWGFNETNFSHRRFETFANPSLDARVPDADEDLARLMHQHPMVLHNRNSDQRALKMSDLLSQRQYHRLELYELVYRPARVEYLMTGGFEVSPAGNIGTLAFGRETMDFSEDDRELLDLFRPHLRQAYENADAMTTFESQLECREQSLEEALDATVIVVRDLSIKHASPMARRWLSSFFSDDKAPNDLLPERLRRWLRFSQTALDGKQSDLKPCIPLTVESDHGRLHIRMLKSAPDGDLVLLMRREVGRDCPESLRCLGLARRESEVLFWISKGKTNSETATILSITRKTVDKHLERIHRKLGVETRTAAAAMAWSTMRDLQR
jgi:DNA-binding CsgD family transcriptional regulator